MSRSNVLHNLPMKCVGIILSLGEKIRKFGEIKRSGIRVHVANYLIPETIVSLILFAPAFARFHVINDYG